jgi:hypothetical protein
MSTFAFENHAARQLSITGAYAHSGTEASNCPSSNMFRRLNSRRLIDLTSFGASSGKLESWLHLLSIAGSDTAFVVVRSGLTQTSAACDGTCRNDILWARATDVLP